MKVKMDIDIRKFIQKKEFKILKEILADQEPATIVDMIDELPPEEKLIVFRLLPKDLAAEVFSELEPDDQMNLLSLFKEEKVKEIISSMDPDDRTELFEELPANVVKRLLQYLSPEERRQALELLNYPENSAGRIMTPEYVDLKEYMTVKQAIERIRKIGKNKETVYTLFVVDYKRILVGTIELKDLIFEEDETKRINEIMNEDPLYVYTYTDQEDVAKIMRDYNLIAIPVVDSEKRLVGIITIDDIVDVIEESATEDIQKMAGMEATETSYFHTSIGLLIKKRILWLIMLLLLESVAGFIIDKYSHIISQLTILAAFIPTINAVGGNTGSQISAMIIRSMAVGDIDMKSIWKVSFREIISGLIIGIILAFVMLFRAMVNTHDLKILLSIASSLLIVVIISNILGAMLPFFAKKLKIDPAFISGPLISTVMDVISMSVYFFISTLLINQI